MIMSALYSTHEIIEVTESCNSDSKNRRVIGKQHLGKLSNKYSIKDDINKLFEAIEIGSSCQGFGNPERHYRDKSAMKRPMRVGPSQALGIGISESVSLKQALRGLCISQASEMAAVKKRLSRPSASPGVSESGAIKKLYQAVVVESHEDGQSQISDVVKGNMVEISIVPERSSSNMSHKAPESGLQSIAEASEINGQSFVSLVDAPSQSEKIFKTRMEEDFTSSPTNQNNEISESNDTVSIPGESLNTSKGQHKEGLDKFRTKSLSSNSNVETEPVKLSKRGTGIAEQSLRTHNVVKKKIVPKRSFVSKNRSQHNEGAKNDCDDQTSKVIRQTPDPALENGCEGLEKVSPSSVVDSNASKHDHVPPLSCKSKRIMMKADERSRSGEKGEFSQSSNSIGEYSSTTSYSEESCVSGSSRSGYRPHMSTDLRWEAISSVQKQHGSLGMKHFKLLRKIGGGDIGIVYLSELIGTSCLFAVKVMDNDFLVSRKKMHRAQTEKEILEILDHPFLPSLYGHFTTKKYSCLVMEYCPGGDLHVLRQRQLTRSFSEKAARFYAAEILLALEYLHMLGVVYRDLKPENILVRDNGHIMLSDFDLSLRCTVNPMLLKSSSPVIEPPKKMSSPCSDSSCIDPFCLQPSWQLSCFTPRFLTAASKTRKLKSELAAQVIPLPQLVVEPITARSNSFVGTHEYLAPEIIKGEGHGSAVDWWTFGVFLYELLYGKTPFKGSSNEETISNVVSQCLKFPQCPMVGSHARDLIRRLLKKEPENRLGSAKGAVEIKQHPFFEGLNWALIRCETPPELPRSFDLGNVVLDTVSQGKKSKLPAEFVNGGDGIEFEMF